MYNNYYGFRESPFSLLPDPDFLFLSQKHETALTLLELAVLNQSGFCVISGEVGAGKTTIVRKLLNQLDESICVGLVSNTHSTFKDLLSWVTCAYGLETGSGDPVALYQQFSDFVIRQYAAGKHTLLIVDEAQNLSISALEELRMLSNINSDKDLVFQIVLVGQTELRDKLQKPELAQFAQRISIDHHLAALSEIETEAYIQHRLRKAGGSGDIFDKKACQLIYRHSGGIPRLINRISDLSLVYGFAQESPQIDVDIIRSVVQEQELTGLNQKPDVQSLSPVPLQSGSLPVEVGFLPPDRKTVLNRTAKDGKDGPQKGDKTMKKVSAERQAPDENKNATTVISTADTKAGIDEHCNEPSGLETSGDLYAIARKAGDEKALAERVANDKAKAAKAAVGKAAADLAAVERATAEHLKADKLAAEKTNADRVAAAHASDTRALANKANTDRLAADKIMAEKVEGSDRAAEQLAEMRQSAEKQVVNKVSIEKAADEKAAFARKVAEEAAEAAAAAVHEARRALAQRVAAEKEAASRIATAEQSAAQCAAELANAEKIKTERVAIEKEALAKAETARIEAEKAASEKAAAVKACQELLATVKQLSGQADVTRAAAEEAAAELEAAEKLASEKDEAEKIALADVAASIAAQAKKEAEEAQAAQAAALEEARRKQAIAEEAAMKAAEASAAVNKSITVTPTKLGRIDKGRIPTDDDRLKDVSRFPVQDAPRNSKQGRIWGLMTLFAVIAGATGWLAINKTLTEADGGAVVAGQAVTAPKAAGERQPAASAAAMEVKEVMEK